MSDYKLNNNIYVPEGKLLTETDVASGTYIPTILTSTNVDSNPTSTYTYDTRFIKVGNIVFVQSRIKVTATALSEVNITISLPIASNLDAFADLLGSGGTDRSNVNLVIFTDTSLNGAKIRFTPTELEEVYYYSFSYIIK